MTYRHALLVPLILVPPVLAFGCAPEDDDGAGPVTVRDSSGVEIVESREPAWTPEQAWTVGEEPFVTIGAASGAEEYQLSRVAGALRLSGGSIVVANGGTNELRFYDADGTHRTTVGGTGDGPGEFQALQSVRAYRGDSIAAWDAERFRLSVFSDSGRLGRTTSVDGVDGARASLRGVLADGSLVLEPTRTAGGFMELGGGTHRDTVAYLRLSPEGEVGDTLARAADRELVVAREGNVISMRSVLFGRDSFVAAGDDRIYVGESDAFRVDVLLPDGTPVRSLRRPTELRPVTDDLLRTAREDARERSRANAAEAAGIAGRPPPGPYAEDVPHRSPVPAFDALAVDGAGHLWVRTYVVPNADVARWLVFDGTGRWLGTVETPAGLQVDQIGTDWILGRTQNELGVESVVLHRLRRESAR